MEEDAPLSGRAICRGLVCSPTLTVRSNQRSETTGKTGRAGGSARFCIDKRASCRSGREIFSGKENPHLELRVESFNTFNHTQFQNVQTGYTNANFGAVTSTYDPRQLQFGGKFVF